MQSRVYQKKIESDDSFIERTAYEVSISKLSYDYGEEETEAEEE
jgi:hypothetical protein